MWRFLIAESSSSQQLLAIMALMNNEGYDDRYVLRDAAGMAMPFAHYAIRRGERPAEFGITDKDGHTGLHLTGNEPDEISVYIAG